MDSIIADNLRTEQTVSSRIDLFFGQHSISKLLKKSNFYKSSGVPCVEVLKALFTLVFTDKNLYRSLETSPDRITFRKNTAYRFLNSVSYNWSKFLSLLAAYVVDSLNKATSKERVNVLIIDDSFYDRNRSKKVELLARVFDHTTHKYVKGFKMLTLGWSDGSTTIVFMRYIMLALEARNAADYRTVGGFFYDICDEVKDIRFTEALMLILDLLARTLTTYPVISEEMATIIYFSRCIMNSRVGKLR